MRTLLLLASISLVFGMGISGCTTTPSGGNTPPPVNVIGCSVETVVAGALSASIATTLQCSNQSAIQASLQGALGSVNLCAAATTQAQIHAKKQLGHLKGVVGDVVCPLAVDAVASLIGTAIPAAWGCTSPANTSLSSVLSSACVAVVPI